MDDTSPMSSMSKLHRFDALKLIGVIQGPVSARQQVKVEFAY